ncbi:MAG TPA: hypothetical protein VFV38_05315 [Ktedonobacteraceae bacterium]|nr:hypothetical protein [Ktedonobacteraceae bacterium]
MSRNDFYENYAFGVKQYRWLLERFYHFYCYEGRSVFLNQSRFSDWLQRERKTDTVIQKTAESSSGIEEKVVSWPEEKAHPHTAFFLETRSCTNRGHESQGWMVTCKADTLLYAFEIKDLGLLAYLLDFPRLQQWFWEQYLPHLPRPDYGRVVLPDANRTEGRVVAIATVVRQVPTECFLLPFEGECCPLAPITTIQRLREAYLHKQRLVLKKEMPQDRSKDVHPSAVRDREVS